MRQITHQTVRLGSGKHSSPNDGACVMELASLLAGENFSDHPLSVSQSIAAFLRRYNDMLDDTRRQDLYAYASRVVGTRGTRHVENLRAERLARWAHEVRRTRRRSLPSRLERRLHRDGRTADPEWAARSATRAIRRSSEATHAEVLELIDELIAIGSPNRASLDWTRPVTDVESSSASPCRSRSARARI